MTKMSQQKKMSVRRRALPNQRFRCCYCDCNLIIKKYGNERLPFHPRNETIEHLTLRSLGGSDRYENLAISCLECNLSRGYFIDWLTYKSIIQEEWEYLPPELIPWAMFILQDRQGVREHRARKRAK